MTEFVRMRSRPAEPDKRRPRSHGGSDGETPAALLFAILLFFLIGFLSLWQLTAEPRALSMIEAGLASATDIDRLLDDNREDLQRYARANPGQTFAVPGFPLDVAITPDEVANSSQAELREILLQRASAAVYEKGAHAFDLSGDQSISRFSSEGGLRFLLDRLTGGVHTVAAWTAIAIAVVAGFVGFHVLRREDSRRRFQVIGTFAAIAGIAGCAVTFVAKFFVDRLGGNDPFSADLRDLADTALSVPMTNYLVVFGSGIVVALVGLGFRAAQRRLPADLEPGPAPGDGYDFEVPDFGDASLR